MDGRMIERMSGQMTKSNESLRLTWLKVGDSKKACLFYCCSDYRRLARLVNTFERKFLTKRFKNPIHFVKHAYIANVWI